MVEIAYNRKKTKVTADGHAQSGDIGHDLVCSAVSILILTLAEDAKHISERSKVKIEQGHAEIVCKSRSNNSEVARMIFDHVCVGFEILASQFPENIKYKVI